MLHVRAVVLAAVLAVAPLSARAADLVVWWEQGYNPEEDRAVEELVAAFEDEAGRDVELTLHPQQDLLARTLVALDAGRPPDFLFGIPITFYYHRWAHDGRLADLSQVIGPFAAQFDRDALDRATLLDATTGRRGLFGLPMGRSTMHVHAWKSLLERAGLTLADIPQEWEAFWTFWCDEAQPAVRKALGRDDIWGVGLPMSGEGVIADTWLDFLQFVHAYGADYVTRDGRLVIDERSVRAALIEALAGYTAIHRRGCNPPDAAHWRSGADNNRAFLAQRVVMTINDTLSIPNALRAMRPEDYYKNAATIEWPRGGYGQPVAIYSGVYQAVVFRDGGNTALAKEFVRFLLEEGWLAHWLDFAGERITPPMPALLRAPFWLDPGDPHRMRSAMQFLTQPRAYDYVAVSGDWRHSKVAQEAVWPKAVHRVVTTGISPEQAVDEAIARIKQILAE